MISRIGHRMLWVLLTIFLSLVLNSCQAFQQPPEEVLTPQEVILTSAAQTVIANLTPAATTTIQASTPSPTLNGPSPTLPTLEASPQTSLTPAPTPAFRLDFEDSFEEAGYWEIANEENFRAYYIPQGYRIENYSEETDYSRTIWLDYGDVRVEANAIQTAGPESAYFGVVCRWQDERNYYAFAIAKTGTFGIARIQNGEVIFLEEGRLEADILPAGRPWRIAGSCLGSRLILEFEGEKLAETLDAAFPVGLVGLLVGTRGEAGAEVNFEDFRAYTPVSQVGSFPTETPEVSLTETQVVINTAQPTPTPLETMLPSPTVFLPSPTPTDLPFPTPTSTSIPIPAPLGTPTTEPTATPEASLIFEDDFSIRAGWHTEQRATFEMYYQSGGYRIHNLSLNSNVSSMRTFEQQDTRVEVDASMLVKPAGGYYGVVCRWLNPQNLYAFVIGMDGFHAIVKIQNREVSFLAEGRLENGPINPVDEVNRISGICQGSLLALEINGQRLLEAEDISFGTGNIGLLVGNQDQQGSLVHFDNFALYALE